MKQYHPHSWSEQARRMANNQFYNYCFYRGRNIYFEKAMVDCFGPEGDTLVGEILRSDTEKYYTWFFRTSYKAPIIRYRAAKRFGRLIRHQNRGMYLKIKASIPFTH